MKKRGIFGAVAAAGISVAAVIAAYKMNQNKKVFTREKWNDSVNKRYKMADSLISDGGLIGKKRSEIIDLLGINGLRSNTKDSMEYYLGSESEDELKILILDFDEEDTVINCTACL